MADPQLSERIARVRARIALSCERAGRDPGEVTLVAVTKTWGPDVVRAAVAEGLSDLGENRAQELREKALAAREVRWHFIGPLQTNKVKHVVGVADLIHSIDRPGIAHEISRRAISRGITQKVLLEVNVSGEPTKHGVPPAQAPRLAEEVASLEGLSVEGLMGMAPLMEDPVDARPYFEDLAQLRELIARDIPTATHLSMGMTRDLEIAVEEGATLVRVGEALFGKRRQRV